MLLFILIETSGINNVDTLTYKFLCTHDGTKEEDKKHENWQMITSIKKAQSQSGLGMNNRQGAVIYNALFSVLAATNCVIVSLSLNSFSSTLLQQAWATMPCLRSLSPVNDWVAQTEQNLGLRTTREGIYPHLYSRGHPETG